MNNKYLTTVVLAFSVIITACSDSEEKDKIAAKVVTENFIEAMEDGDIREAKKYCDKDTRDLILQYEEDFVDFFERGKFKLKEPKITNGKKAKISANGRTMNIVFRLVKDDSEWKISMDDLEDWEPTDNSYGGDRTIETKPNQAEATADAEATESAGDYGEANDEAQFLCRNGQSIPYRWYNDGDCDCSDCSDEPYRKAPAAPREAPAATEAPGYGYGYDYDEYGSTNEDVFYCWNGREIPWSWVNDGECDCEECEDEDE